MTLETKNKIDASTEVRARIEHSLHIRTAPRGTTRAEIEQLVKDEGARLWAQLKKRPSLGVALTAGAGLGLAMLVGAAELTIAIAAGYGAYQVLREGVPPRQAAANVVKQLEHLG